MISSDFWPLKTQVEAVDPKPLTILDMIKCCILFPTVHFDRQQRLIRICSERPLHGWLLGSHSRIKGCFDGCYRVAIVCEVGIVLFCLGMCERRRMDTP
ncbi:hypothetical protein PILCRDRAFT_630637 [Piloderma croceum F 1598]|uniref:Uncharacterized protein n=1 Tax=Piloderma croceum (strain F 1598) TaxID=765440 RepID=A0A0C3FBE1_PILCF|nr:hypothetical protein PILCRDRAFT_630637 [Piloderma croceum F 1598]